MSNGQEFNWSARGFNVLKNYQFEITYPIQLCYIVFHTLIVLREALLVVRRKLTPWIRPWHTVLLLEMWWLAGTRHTLWVDWAWHAITCQTSPTGIKITISTREFVSGCIRSNIIVQYSTEGQHRFTLHTIHNTLTPTCRIHWSNVNSNHQNQQFTELRLHHRILNETIMPTS